ncbi:hypothetical protein U0070_013230 [Myodes glareolus]|uniref:NEDD4-binding protein 1 n=1 Tax=Myodes glareolus TaxID=447135 RepID=A0AAW0HJX9_MYOGA
MKYIIAVKFFSNMGYSKEIVEKVIRKCEPSTQPLLLLEEIEKENQRLQGHRACAPCSVCPDAAQSRSAGVGGSTNELTGDFTPKNTQSHTEQNMEEKFSQLSFKDSKPYTSNGRVNSFRTGPAGQKHEMWGSNQKGSAEPSLPNNVKAACEKPSGCCRYPQHKPHHSQLSPPLPLPQLLPSDTDAGLAGASDHTNSVVTGVQRFRDMLRIPYKLELKNEPGRADLKHIVIDGCNVALIHGVKKFFSCRGIAIAVEYFWKLGHRNITVFVPQWRTRRDPNVTEQHFLTQLQELGILSLTPFRTVFGERIASHVDRFLQHLVHKTGGAIVSNDNFREFVAESVSWREIIAKRLLQYTFMGDIFMVPDNPLGRNGPWLEEFLRKEGFRRDVEPLLSALPNVDTFARSHNTQQPHFTSLTTVLGPQQNHLMPAHRSSAETSELREALLKIFPDSEQNEDRRDPGSSAIPERPEHAL